MKTGKSIQISLMKFSKEITEIVNEFQYLGTRLTHYGNINSEIKRRCAMATQKLEDEKVVARRRQFHRNHTLMNFNIYIILPHVALKSNHKENKFYLVSK